MTIETVNTVSGRHAVVKKAAMKIKPGQFVRVKWNDAPVRVVLVTQLPGAGDMREPGAFTLRGICREGNNIWNEVFESDQVVEILGRITWPD